MKILTILIGLFCFVLIFFSFHIPVHAVTPTLTPTPTRTLTPTRTRTPTLTPNPTRTLTPARTRTPSPTRTPTPHRTTPTRTPTVSKSPTPSKILTPTRTPTPTVYLTDVGFQHQNLCNKYDICNLGSTYNNYGCLAFNLNETLATTRQGNTGQGCTFTIETEAIGEWVNHGGWYGSPPYGWGQDLWYTGLVPDICKEDLTCYPVELSMTCNQPDYTLDTSHLPSFLEYKGSENVQGHPSKKKFTFKVSATAAKNKNFGLTFLATAYCDMRMKANNHEADMIPVKIFKTGGCNGMERPITINPRVASKRESLQVDTSGCIPTGSPTITPAGQLTATPTPARTVCGGSCSSSQQCVEQCPICYTGAYGSTCVAASPTPTKVACGGPCSVNTQCDIACPICAIGASGGVCRAQIPTPTPRPPSATPTPRPPSATPTPFCECDGLDVSGNPNFTTNSTVNVIGYGKISNPQTNNAQVLNMVYKLVKDGNPYVTSAPVPAAGPTVIPNPPAWRYASSWSATIPGPGNYRIEEKINCGYRQTSNPLAMSVRTETAVLQSSTRQGAIFGFFADLFSGIFGSGNQVRNQSAPPPTNTPTPTPFDPLSSDALKLGTFNPLDTHLTLGCTWAEFTVVQ